MTWGGAGLPAEPGGRALDTSRPVPRLCAHKSSQGRSSLSGGAVGSEPVAPVRQHKPRLRFQNANLAAADQPAGAGVHFVLRLVSVALADKPIRWLRPVIARIGIVAAEAGERASKTQNFRLLGAQFTGEPGAALQTNGALEARRVVLEFWIGLGVAAPAPGDDGCCRQPCSRNRLHAMRAVVR